MLSIFLQHLYSPVGYAKLESKDFEELKNNGFDVFILNDEFLILIDRQKNYWLVLFNTSAILAFNSLFKFKYNDFLFTISTLEKVNINSTISIYEGMLYFRDKHFLKEFEPSLLVRNSESGALHYLKPFYNIFFCCSPYGCQHQKIYSEYDGICSICKACAPPSYFKKCCCSNSACSNKIVNSSMNGLNIFSKYIQDKFNITGGLGC